MIGSKGFVREHRSKIFGKKVHETRIREFKKRGIMETGERRLNPGRRKGALNNP